MIFCAIFIFWTRGDDRKKNIMGICTDHALNMISSGEASLTSRLKRADGLKHIIVVHDLSHALNLALKTSIKRFSKYCLRSAKLK